MAKTKKAVKKTAKPMSAEEKAKKAMFLKAKPYLAVAKAKAKRNRKSLASVVAADLKKFA